MPPRAPQAKFETLSFLVAMQRINIFHYFSLKKLLWMDVYMLFNYAYKTQVK